MTLLLAAVRRLRCRLVGHADPETAWVGGGGWAWALTCPRCGETWGVERRARDVVDSDQAAKGAQEATQRRTRASQRNDSHGIHREGE